MTVMPESFTAKERDFIRWEFVVRAGQVPLLREGFYVQRWAGGPNKGKVKLRAVVQSMLDRGLIEIVEPEGRMASALFTAAGIEALREMAKDQRFLPPDKYGHLLEELEDL